MIDYFDFVPFSLFEAWHTAANARPPKREIIDVEYEDITDRVLVKPPQSETETNNPKQLNP